MADALDDEWWLTNEDEVKSDEKESPKKKRKHLTESECRKSDNDSDGPDNKDTAEQHCKSDIVADEEPPVKKKKKSSRKKISEVLAKQKPKPLSAKHLLDAMDKYFDAKLSAIEKDEVKLKEKNFCTCNDMTHTPTSFMKSVIPKWKKLKSSMDKTVGSPLVLVVTSAAIRATELIRQLADFRGDDCKVGKLFAKHMKIEDQNKFLKKAVIHIGVGTPNRLHALLAEGSLHLSQVKYIVFDWSWRDVKLRRLIDIKEIKGDLMKLLQTYIVPHVKQTKAKITLL